MGDVALDSRGSVLVYRYQEQQKRHIGTTALLATGGFAGVVSKTYIAPLVPHHPLPGSRISAPSFVSRVLMRTDWELRGRRNFRGLAAAMEFQRAGSNGED